VASYSYRAMDTQGKILRGRLEALNALDLELRLRRMSLDLITHDRAQRRWLTMFGPVVKRRELITFCFHLEQLLRSRVPIVEALTDLRDTVDIPHFREVLANLIEEIQGGARLSDALAMHPRVFDQVFVNLIRSGEESGRLQEVLGKLTENLKWQDEIDAQTRRVLLYPVVSGLIMAGAAVVLLLEVVPSLAQVVRMMQPDLPTPTRILLGVSETLAAYWWAILTLPPVLYGLAYLWVKSSPAMQFRLDDLKLRIPGMGAVLRKIILARFATFFALMYSSGVSILDCIQISEKIAGNRVVEQGLQRVGRAIAEGSSVTASFQGVGLFPPLVLRMFSVGETTGALDVALENVSYFYNRDVKESVERLQTLIQPIMTLAFAIIFVAVALPLYWPLFDAVGKVKF
jgi:type IV pilus assembly protein PilC